MLMAIWRHMLGKEEGRDKRRGRGKRNRRTRTKDVGRDEKTFEDTRV
jgi:hypothetical protein